MFKVKFADIGEGLTEGVVTEVHVKVGDNIKNGEALFNVETDKVNSDIFAPVDGKISKVLIEQGQEIKVGDVVIEIDDGKENTDSPPKVLEDVKDEENASVVGATPVSNDIINRINVSDKPNNTNNFINQESIIDNSNANVKASPLARKMAAVLGVDLSKVTPSGPNNRILAFDIQSYSSESNNHTNNIANNNDAIISNSKNNKNIDYNNPSITVPEFNEQLSFNSVPMNPIRKATVKAMDIAHSKVASFTGFKNVDITELVNLRNQLKSFADTQSVKLTYLAFIIKAVTLSLKDMPNLNVRIDEENKAIKFANQINIGMACDTPDGLMVPVIKSADKLSVLQIAVKINELANKARTKKLSMNEMTGATFTISNFGSVGLDFATPIVNYPESAILGVGTITKSPGVINDQIEIRDFMPFSLTADHKVIDGADAGRFLQRVSYYLQNPAILLV
ncbi:dihydrolipoamide acetyltransferase family protein [Spiroplasma turonicum]|uniref:Dihydrolipoamide acetyltransferase component of pyruvate dehydrogenase complex n=1 Tax=Spiroplasma turonicum TaxID=216946 RepID=A0A0K1P5X5_9MOLU|nr:dihydrolipoamide acetyltransferase family protein [Spiroplasma turonicum]AKU79706.1 pyruvate dehydrogenase E2 component (dihydrolipoamide acetyltransferase) [Spiroplasma turonicum]ALX70724.1 pyruvate dehydrogenase E2 component (dihydrolipoamide acetyltransferase) [Spiroplasma turonicum]